MNEPGPSLRRLRAAALVALLIGAAGSIALFLRAGRQSDQRLVLLLIAIWVLSPFAVLALADVISRRWSVPTRAALYWVMLTVTLGSLAVYGADAVWPRTAQPAFFFVAVPPASWLVIGVVIVTAALIARRRSRRRDGA